MDTNDIRLNPFLLNDVPGVVQTLDMIQAAVDTNPKAICFVRHKYDIDLDSILEQCAIKDPESICYLPRLWTMEELILSWQVMIGKNDKCIRFIININYDFISIWNETKLPIISKIIIGGVELIASMNWTDKGLYITHNLHIIFTIFHKELSVKATTFIFNRLRTRWGMLLYLVNYSDEMMKYVDTYIPLHYFDKSYYLKYNDNTSFKKAVERMLDYDFDKYSGVLDYNSEKANLEFVKRDINIIKMIPKKNQSLTVVSYVLLKDPDLRKYCNKIYANMVLGDEVKIRMPETNELSSDIEERSYIDQSRRCKKTSKKDIRELYKKDKEEYLNDPKHFNLKYRHEFFLSDQGIPLPYEYNISDTTDIATLRLPPTYVCGQDSIGKTIHRATYPKMYGGAIGGTRI